jgi:hypothetical protein
MARAEAELTAAARIKALSNQSGLPHRLEVNLRMSRRRCGVYRDNVSTRLTRDRQSESTLGAAAWKITVMVQG